ncbi:MAG TPA: DegT/DnrJ/EryC1/StrS family aminotransferase [Methanomicrobiales archaeon]|nr:DegT/DnrJ/EryC1/StrS family aminotransferase [Methanomicrobiales archaeon]
MTTMIPVSKPCIGREEADAVARVMYSGMIAQDGAVAAFEQAFASYIGVRHAIATSSGTTALHAALLAAGIGPGDEVIVPSFTFIATATSVSMCGARPVFADVDDRFFTLDLVSAEPLVTGRTKAVLGVHLFGQPFDVPALADLCRDHGLLLLEDACQAHGSTFQGKRVGSLGEAACFSFYATKNMTTGEGGMVTTDDPDLAGRVRLLINHGQKEKYHHTTLGYNYRMTDMNGAMGLVQLGKLEGMNAKRVENAKYLDRVLRCPGVIPPAVRPDSTHVYHQYVVKVEKGAKLTRDGLMQALAARGVGTAVHYPRPVHDQPLYRDQQGQKSCPVSARLASSVLSLPVHPLVSGEDLEAIGRAVNGLM